MALFDLKMDDFEPKMTIFAVFDISRGVSLGVFNNFRDFDIFTKKLAVFIGGFVKNAKNGIF